MVLMIGEQVTHMALDTSEAGHSRPSTSAHTRNLVPGTILVCLVWRIVVVNALALSFPRGVGPWVTLAAEGPLYAGIALLLWATWGSWRTFHIDTLSVGMFLTFGALLRTSTVELPGTAELVDALVFLVLSILLVVSLRGKGVFYWQRIRERSAWIPGLSLGCIAVSAAVVLPGAVALLAQSHMTQLFAALAIRYSLEFIQEMGHAAILEEPIFRGFLWGYLAERGWNDRRIVLAQAGLFWLAHLPRNYAQPLVLFLTLPAGGLFYGWLASRTRSVAPSMVAHAIYNAFVGMMEALVATF